MNHHPKPADFGKIVAPGTVVIERLLPGPIERVWDYLTQSDLRGKWLAVGDLPAQKGATFNLHWHFASWATPAGQPPEGMTQEPRLESELLALDPPHHFAFTWRDGSQVDITLENRGTRVLLKLTHARLPNRGTTVGVSSGWHAHLDLLAAVLDGSAGWLFWDHWRSLRPKYENLIPAETQVQSA